MSDNEKTIEDFTEEEKENFIAEMFNRKTKDFVEYKFTTKDFIETDDGKIEFLDKELITLIKEAFVLNKEVRFNMESLCIFIQK